MFLRHFFQEQLQNWTKFPVGENPESQNFTVQSNKTYIKPIKRFDTRA